MPAFLRRRHMKTLKLIVGTLIVITLIFMYLIHLRSYPLETAWIHARKSVIGISNGNGGLFKDSSAPHAEWKVLQETCPNATLGRTVDLNNVQCKKMPPVAGSCKVAEELFFSAPSATCNHQKEFKFCVIKEVHIGKHKVKCNPSMCSGSISLGITQPQNGKVHWQALVSVSELEKRITQLTQFGSSAMHFGFCYVRCRLHPEDTVILQKNFESDYLDRDSFVDEHVQLLVLPPQIKLARQEIDNLPQRKMSDYKSININVIFVDSVSRMHFYRSLTKTIAKFHDLAKDGIKPLRVFDFDLFQGIKDRTFENLQALFEGVVDLQQEPFGLLEFSRKPLAVEKLFKPLKNIGYRTLWLEDLCWNWEWGFPKDLHAFNKSLSSTLVWKRLQKALNTANVDNMDITFASCDILQANGKTDPFHGVDSVCYNGQFHHSYLVNYLKQYQRLFGDLRLPYVSFLMTNVGHDETGRRIQTFDQDLADYVDFLKSQENTLTILLSDHGNSYGKFIEKTTEGRLELYRPFLFILVPEKISQLLGEQKVHALEINQNRLVSILDVHYTLSSLIPNFTPFVSPYNERFNISQLGLFDTISPKRTCADMPLYPPAICLCEGDDVAIRNNDDQALIAEFALGQLNNKLSQQFHNSHPTAISGFGNCMKLMAHRFDNVRESRRYDGAGHHFVLTKMDIFVLAAGAEVEEGFLVSVKSNPSKRKAMKLISFTRISTYAYYKVCADVGVDLPLCICDVAKQHVVDYSQHFDWRNMPANFQHDNQVSYVQNQDCVLLFVRSYSTGAVFEIFNGCSSNVMVSINWSVQNLAVSSEMPMEALLFQGNVMFLSVLRQSVVHLPWKWKFTAQAKNVT